MKDIVKISNRSESYKTQEMIFAAASHIIVGILALIASRTVVMDKLLPFGLSFLAGCSITYTPAAAIGVFIGYFFPAVGSGAFRYIAAMFAILAIKLLLGEQKKLINNPFFLSLVCFLCTGVTAIVALRGMGGNILSTISEVILSTGTTYFVSRSFRGISKDTAGLSVEELASLLIVISFLLTGLSKVNFNGISLGHIIGITLILAASKYGGVISGAICGISLAFTFSLCGLSGQICIALAFAGLLCGIFSSYGKYMQVAVMVIFSIVGAAVTGDITVTAETVIESACGSVLFLLLPRKAGIYLGKIFSSYPKLTVENGFKKALTMRLNLASNAMKDVSETVEQVSAELSKINAPDFSSVISGVEHDSCAGCKLRIYCWESKRDDTIAALFEMTKAVKHGDYSPELFATEEFKGRCLRPSAMGNSVYKRYSEYASRIAAENRIDEVRGVVSDQFDGISSMLSDLSIDFEYDEKFDHTSALNAATALKNINIRVDECSSRIDKYGRMTLEFKIKKASDLVLNKMQIMKTISTVCERDFDIPNISEVGGDVFMILNEHAKLRVDVGVAQICASENTMCGDAYKYFYDGRGHFTAILSDGMGTGGRAAVDGAMAAGLMSRLIKAGFGYDCSLRILNSSMLFKSTDESLATVDIATIDLHSGNTDLYKAGAAPTIVRRSGHSGKAESTSLPVGILRTIGFDSATVKCHSGDIILLMSDGATNEGTDWIREEIEAWQDGSAQDLSDHICDCAHRRRSDNHSDDITVLAILLDKSV